MARLYTVVAGSGKSNTRAFQPMATPASCAVMSTPRLNDLPTDHKPRERLLAHGPGALSGAELLAIMLVTGRKGRNVVDLARDILSDHRSLAALSRTPLEQLMRIQGIGPAKAVQLAASFELARRVAAERVLEQKMDTPQAVMDLMAPDLRARTTECIRVLLLNTRYHLSRVEEISTGSVNESIAHPREIFRPAIIHAAYAFILVHNHPSGDPSPSEADLRLTRRIQEAAQLLQVRLVDHVIIGMPGPNTPGFFSFKEAGLL